MTFWHSFGLSSVESIYTWKLLVSTPEHYSYLHRLPLNRVESQWACACVRYMWNTAIHIDISRDSPLPYVLTLGLWDPSTRTESPLTRMSPVLTVYKIHNNNHIGLLRECYERFPGSNQIFNFFNFRSIGMQ